MCDLISVFPSLPLHLSSLIPYSLSAHVAPVLLTLLWSSPRPHLGQPQPGRADLHRVLRDPPQPGDTPVTRALAGPGRLATRAHPGARIHREPHGQQCVGELHQGPPEAHAGGQPVSAGKPRHVWGGGIQSARQPLICVLTEFPPRPREERESWIRAKYEQKLFVPPLPAPAQDTPTAMSARLLSTVKEKDLPKLLLLLAHSTKEEINAAPPSPASESPSDQGSALHTACQLGNVVMTQLLVWVRKPLFGVSPGLQIGTRP